MEQGEHTNNIQGRPAGDRDNSLETFELFKAYLDSKLIYFKARIQNR